MRDALIAPRHDQGAQAMIGRKDAVKAGQVHPGCRYPHRRLEAGHVLGKIVLEGR